MSPPRGLFLALLLVLGLAGGAPGVAAAPPAFADIGDLEPDVVLLDVRIQSDGDAAWAVRYRTRLDDDNATAAFESLERDIEANRSAYTGRFADRMTATAAAAQNATGREMSVRDVSVRTTRQEIPQQYGVIVYSFEWTNFAEAESGRLEAGDAIAGLFLDESTALTLQWPDGYGLESVDPDPDETGDRSATWRGPQDFTTDQPSLVVSTAVAGDGGPTASPTTGDGAGTDGGLSPTSLALLAIAVVVAVAGVAWWRRNEDGGDDAAEETEPPPELLSNEERVIRLLAEHGGRMKQQRVVEELGWTDAKTSQVVGDLREAGEIEGFRLGRENVLTLPSEDDEDARS